MLLRVNRNERSTDNTTARPSKMGRVGLKKDDCNGDNASCGEQMKQPPLRRNKQY